MQTHAFLVLVNIPPVDWCCKVDGIRKVIGRSSKAEIQLSDRYPRVSRRHAEIWSDRSKFWLRDLQSRGGTQVNEVWLHSDRPVELGIGDRLSLSGTQLLLVDDVPRVAAVMAETGICNIEPERTCVDTVSIPPDATPQMQPLEVRSRLQRLTPAEFDVVLWMCRGFTDDAELGRLLFRSPHTVRTQIGNILQKLELHSRISILNWLKKPASRSRDLAAADRPTAHELDQRDSAGNRRRA